MTKNEKDTSVIPEGLYCYTYDKNGEYKPCPYHKTIETRPGQYNGWCDFLEKGDIENAQEMTLINEKTGEEIQGNDAPFPVSLLWDGCKECGINYGF